MNKLSAFDLIIDLTAIAYEYSREVAKSKSLCKQILENKETFCYEMHNSILGKDAFILLSSTVIHSTHTVNLFLTENTVS